MEVDARLGGLAVVAVMVWSMAIGGAPSGAREGDVRALITHAADSLDQTIVALGDAVATANGAPSDPMNPVRLRAAFRSARAQYKRLEPVLEFYAPALAAAFNSRRSELDDDDAPPPSTLSGFSAIERLLGSPLTAGGRDSVQRALVEMRGLVTRVRGLPPAITPTDAQIIEMTRLELVRVSTLGIAGFDAPGTGEAMRESAEALDGVRAIYHAAGWRWPQLAVELRVLDSTLAEASASLRASPDFVTLDRLAFLVDHGNPAARSLDSLRRAVAAPPIEMRRGLRADAASVYDDGAFDVRAYAPMSAPLPSDRLIALGRRLFNDPSLSGDGTRSCGSCHLPSRAFADGLRRATSIDPRRGVVARNTPTLINAALQPSQLADERAATLEDQVISVLESPIEMGSSIDRAARSIGQRARYRAEFSTAFGSVMAPDVTPLRVRQALAAYVRTLVSTRSRFDRAVRGDVGALSGEERAGFNLFMGKAGCGTCHFAPLLGGTAPPLYVGSDVEVIGAPASAQRPAVPDADSGRARSDHRPEHLQAFKVPSLRNVAITAPYMHNGVFATLDEVVRFYDGGGGRGAGAPITNQTLSSDSLHLSAGERKAIVAFLGTLTDTAGMGRPQSRR